jgi:hypothetical protein
MNDEQLIWESYQSMRNIHPIIKMVNPSDVKFTEEDQEREKIEQIKKSYGINYSDIEWDEQPKPVITIDDDNNMYVVDGHHRVTAFRELNYPMFAAILIAKNEYDNLHKKYGICKSVIIIADTLGDVYTSGQDSCQ